MPFYNRQLAITQNWAEFTGIFWCGQPILWSHYQGWKAWKSSALCKWICVPGVPHQLPSGCKWTSYISERASQKVAEMTVSDSHCKLYYPNITFFLIQILLAVAQKISKFRFFSGQFVYQPLIYLNWEFIIINKQIMVKDDFHHCLFIRHVRSVCAQLVVIVWYYLENTCLGRQCSLDLPLLGTGRSF